MFTLSVLRCTQVRALALASLSLALAGPAAAQTIYRVVGADGRVTFTDKPPMTDVKPSVAKDRGGVAVDGGGLPAELRQVASRFPVTVYTSASCSACGQARALLKERGVPFSERTIATNEDIEAFRKLSGATSVPYVTIGGQALTGFSEADWTRYLDAAGYPKTSQLPASYRAPAPLPLVTAVAKPVSPNAAPDATTPALPPPPPPAPGGFRF